MSSNLTVSAKKAVPTSLKTTGVPADDVTACWRGGRAGSPRSVTQRPGFGRGGWPR